MNKPKVAVTTRVSGRDGAYLSELLLSKGYEVHGIKCRSSTTTNESVPAGRVVHRQVHQHIEVNITVIGSGGASLLGGACLANPGKVPLEIIEVQSGSYLGEDDIVRFEDTYGRT